MAPPLLTKSHMPESDEKDEHVERHVVYETVSSSSTKSNTITIVVVIVIALALIAWVVMQMR